MDAQESIERARLRRRIAAEVIEWCCRARGGGRLLPRRDGARTAAALELHDLHARHARARGDEETAARADERFDRELDRSVRDPVE
jgi:hypothetical protein